jgi:hypothetical protein
MFFLSLSLLFFRSGASQAHLFVVFHLYNEIFTRLLLLLLLFHYNDSLKEKRGISPLFIILWPRQ